MRESELINHYKMQTDKAQYYLQRYIEELKLHFLLDDKQIIKIFEKEIKNIKFKNPKNFWYKLLNKIRPMDKI